MNKMMLDAFGSGRYYHLNPELHVKEVVNESERSEFPTSIYVKFQEGEIDKMEAGEVSKKFEQYGDFYLFKDTQNSIYLEFFYFDQKVVPDRQPLTLIELLKQDQSMKIEEAHIYAQAPKFKAHNMESK